MVSKIFKIEFWGKQFELSARHKDGGGDLILFIHGLGCSKESFDEAFGFTDLADCQLLAVDLVGYGDSSRPRDFSYSMEDQAEILKLALDDITFDRLHIVAHSMGCAVGLLMVDDLADTLASFVNVEGNLIGADCGLISRKATGIAYDDFKDTFFDKVRRRGPRPWVEQSAKSDFWGFYRSCESLVQWSDTEKLLEMFLALEADKVYVYGDENADMEILGRLEGITKIAVPDSGHFVMNDNPAEFYGLLNKVVTKHTS